ncbi:MAG: HAD family hydrolase [bacterium]|nr:HAD family hydrolase [bacterium]
MLKAVIFDLDGVLVDSFDAVTKFLQDVLVASGYQAPSQAEIQNVFHLPRSHALKILIDSDSSDELERVLSISENVPYPHHLMKTADGVKEVVQELSSLYSLAIVTSKSRKTTDEYLDYSGLGKFLKTVITSEDTNNHKPHPEPLLLASERLGHGPHECIYIGDSNSDIEAARACSMKVIGYSNNVTLQADFQANSFAELLLLISNGMTDKIITQNGTK